MSYRDAEAAIISMAQQARPNPMGQIDDSRAQLSTRSMLVVMKLSSNLCSMSPMSLFMPSNDQPKYSRFFAMYCSHFRGVSSSAKIAATGQAGTHAPQSMHS